MVSDEKNAGRNTRNRLLSIKYDVDTFVTHFVERAQTITNYPIIANERCGVWYCPNLKSTRTCYFKSTDGHVGTWNFSLKRLNLGVVAAVHRHGGCIILDASVRKVMPDSFSRTLPIWCSVLNRIVQIYRKEMQLEPLEKWDTDLYTPSNVVSKQEHESILSLLNDRVEALQSSGAVVNPTKLVQTLTKPLRPYWVTPNDDIEKLCFSYQDHSPIFCVSCCSPSIPHVDFDYIPGAADDEESWACKLKPHVFWENPSEILGDTEDGIAERIQSALSWQQHLDGGPSSFDWVGDTKLAIGTRRAGRPPECWEDFDAILNVTDSEYEHIADGTVGRKTWYLQLPVQEGKRDKLGLERWLAVGIAFIAIHSGKRILIHCAQGRDRSVAVTMAAIVLLCELEKRPLKFRRNVETLTHEGLSSLAFSKQTDFEPSQETYRFSGLSKDLVEQTLMGRPGRDLIQRWLRQELHLANGELATKETLRVALHTIQQFREKASPSRSTMQKLNRFFMSVQHEE